MKQNDWKKLSRIFDLVLTLPPEGRTDYIKRVCGDDKELEEKIREMLDQLEESDRFFEERLGKNEKLIKELDSLLAEQEFGEDYFEGKKIGRWDIQELIGHGGMGRVYKVQRVDESGIKQTGALKIIHKSLLTPSHMERFRLEQHILSGLQHPNISGFVDSGITADRVPYMVMEFVNGETILDYCNNRKLTIEQRLELFKTVCKAIQYAHNSLIIHRDLKPENILVTDEGRIKILDFGIAKLLDPNLYENSAIQTQPGMRMLSLEYASPEQISGKLVTTSTDLYSLGILLSKLLTGLHPFDLKNLTYKEVENRLLNEDPVSVSRRFLAISDADQKKRLAEERGCAPSDIINQLKGDLDSIINKILHKDPDRRYGSVEALLADINRHQQNLPLLARPDTFGYRARKFISRNRWTVAAAAMIFLILTGGITATMWQAHQAEQNAREAEQVSAFLAQIFEGSDPNRANDGSMTARELLDQGFERAQTELEDETGLQAQILSMIGNIYSNLGLYEDAYLAIGKSVEAFRSIGDKSPHYAAVMLRLANLEYRLDNFEAAADAAREALLLSISQNGETHPETSSVMNTLAMSLEELGEKEEAYEIYRRIIEIRRGQPDQGSNLAINLNNLAIMLQQDGKLDEADELFAEAVELIDDVLGSEHPFMAYILNGYSGLHQDREDFDLAEANLRRALEIGQAIFPETHPFIGVVYYNLAELFKLTENFSEAVHYYENSLELRRVALPQYHSDIASTLLGLGTAQIEMNLLENAQNSLLEVIDIYKSSHDESDWRVARAEGYLGLAMMKEGRFLEAKEFFDKSYQVLLQSLGDDHRFTQKVFADKNKLERLKASYSDSF
ncbi:MAG: tetratricopeptide repeat protein [Balneolaceae bacterium]|nr:tetratricopeptide repeat protein [Balneolaceae bacterium]